MMEKGGAGVAVGSWVVSAVGFADTHSQAILAACAVVGAVVGVVGMVWKAWYMRAANKRLVAEHHARMQLMRSGKNV